MLNKPTIEITKLIKDEDKASLLPEGQNVIDKFITVKI